MARQPQRRGFRAASSSAGPAPPPDLDAAERTALAQRRPEALERFYDVYFPKVYGYVARMVQDTPLAEDLTQETFLHVLRAIASYDPRRPLRPWVFTIATNKVRDHWSSRAFQDRAAGAADADLEEEAAPRRETPAPERGPRETLAGEELARAVDAAIARLPELLRQTLLLRFHEELPFEEIARIVERNEVAVRKRYSRALSELRELLGGVHDLGPLEDGVG